MRKKVVPGVLVLLLVLVAAGGFVAYSFFRPPQEASAPIEAIPLDTDEAAPAAAADDNAPAAATNNDTDDTDNTNDTDGAYDAYGATDTEPTPTTSAPAAPQPAEAPAGTAIFEIVQDESQARFLIDEVLRGDPITVVGATDQVAGQISFNANNMSDAQVGIIQINARTLATDNEFRNRAIKNRILLTDEHEFVRFEPTEIIDLPTSAEPGETYAFQIVGDLTVTAVTRPVTFDVTVTPVDETRLEGTALAVIDYADFDLAIPEVPAVDTVADEVQLELDFVATANEE